MQKFKYSDLTLLQETNRAARHMLVSVIIFGIWIFVVDVTFGLSKQERSVASAETNPLISTLDYVAECWFAIPIMVILMVAIFQLRRIEIRDDGVFIKDLFFFKKISHKKIKSVTIYRNPLNNKFIDYGYFIRIGYKGWIGARYDLIKNSDKRNALKLAKDISSQYDVPVLKKNTFWGHSEYLFSTARRKKSFAVS